MADAGQLSILPAPRASSGMAMAGGLTGPGRAFAGAAVEDVVVTDGRRVLARKDLHITYAELLARHGLSSLAADGDYDPIAEAERTEAIFSFSAVFAEVARRPETSGWSA